MFTKTVGHLRTIQEGEYTKIILSGDFDSSLNEPFDELIAEFCEKGIHKVILDLELCTFIYSVGIGKIVSLYKKLEKIDESDFFIVNPDDRIKKLINLVNLGFLVK